MLYKATVYNTTVVWYKLSAYLYGIIHCCIVQHWNSTLYESALYNIESQNLLCTTLVFHIPWIIGVQCKCCTIQGSLNVVWIHGFAQQIFLMLYKSTVYDATLYDIWSGWFIQQHQRCTRYYCMVGCKIWSFDRYFSSFPELFFVWVKLWYALANGLWVTFEVCNINIFLLLFV